MPDDDNFKKVRGSIEGDKGFMIIVGLLIILAIVLLAPFSVKFIEEELEIFLFLMGCLAVSITSAWSGGLIKEVLTAPIGIALAVCVCGLLFYSVRRFVRRCVDVIVGRIGLRLFVFLLIVSLGFLSSLVTAVIAALILVEVVSGLGLERRDVIRVVILTCFSIGLGAALTPVGEPLSTITIAKLRGLPYNADFFFLFRHLGIFIAAGVVLFGAH